MKIVSALMSDTPSSSKRHRKVSTPPGKRRRAKASRTQRKALLKQRIVNAALKLFQKKGFDSTTTKAIARQAGIAEGTVFNYFRTKEDIALYFFDQEVDHAIAAVRNDRGLRRAPLEQKLFALVQNQLEYLGPHERFIGAAFVNAFRPGSPLSFSSQALALRTKYLDFVQELIQQSRKKGGTSTLDWWASQAFWIYYVGILLYWLNDSSPGKQHTLAFLDRSLALGTAILKGRRR